MMPGISLATLSAKLRHAVGPYASGFTVDPRLKQRLDRIAFSWRIREDFYRHMAIQVSNETDELAALERFHKRLLRKKRHSCASVLQDVIRRTNDGRPLSAALRHWVPPEESLAIQGGEIAGKVAASFTLIIEAKTYVKELTRTMRSAFTTPAVYVAALFVVLWSIGRFITPTISMAISANQAQGSAAYIYTLGSLANSPLAILPIMALLIMIAWLQWALPNWTSPLRRICEGYFPFNFYREIQGFIWITTFASMLKSGMPDVTILETQAARGTPYLRQRLNAVRRKMNNGVPLATALIATGYEFPSPDLIDDIESMAEFPDFADRISKRTQQWAEEIQYLTRNRVKQIGFAFEMVMYVLMMFVLVGITQLSTQTTTIAPH